jgi:hypothetical protein
MKQVVQDDNGGANDDDDVPQPGSRRYPPNLSVTKNIVKFIDVWAVFLVDEDLVVFYLELLGKRTCRLSTVAAAAVAAVRWGYLHQQTSSGNGLFVPPNYRVAKTKDPRRTIQLMDAEPPFFY